LFASVLKKFAARPEMFVGSSICWPTHVAPSAMPRMAMEPAANGLTMRPTPVARVLTMSLA
jgi:hypothetical protein